jgi:hypothetical protein
MKNLKINHLACVVSIIALTALGFLWYGPILLGDKWMGLVGLTEQMISDNPPGVGTWITNLIATILPVYFLAWLFTQLNVESGVRGALIGFGIAFCFIFMTEMTSNMFAFRPYELTWVAGGFNLVGLTIVGFILGAWRKYSV